MLIKVVTSRHTILNSLILKMDLNMEQILTSTLRKRKTRGFGFRLLICYLKKSDLQLAEKNANLWLTITFQSCNITEIRLYGDLIFSSMALLIQKVQHDGALSKAFATTYLAKVFETLSINEIYENERCILAALKTIKRCLKYYPRAIKSGKVQIEKFLVNLLGSSNSDVVYQTGECWLLLQNIRGAFNNGNINDKCLWREYQLKLLNHLDFIIQNNFSISEDTIDSSANSNTLDPLAIKLATDPLERAAQIFRRFKNIVVFLKIALSKPFINKKLIYTQRILRIIQSGLAVHTGRKTNTQLDHVCFLRYLPEVKIQLLELLEILIDVCYTHLRMDFRLILNILLDSLENTKTLLDEGNATHFVNVRLIVYRVITLWCATLQEGSHCDIISETLIKEILSDILPQRTNMSISPINRGNQISKCPPKKSFSVLELSLGNEDKELLHKEAYHCLHKLLSSSGHLLRVSFLKDVHNSLLEICSRMHSEPMNKQHLPAVWNCRLEVYNAFVFLLKSRNNGCPPPSEIFINLFNESSLLDKSIELRINSKILIEALEPSLHPLKTDINFKKYSGNRQFEPFREINVLDQEEHRSPLAIDIQMTSNDDGVENEARLADQIDSKHNATNEQTPIEIDPTTDIQNNYPLHLTAPSKTASNITTTGKNEDFESHPPLNSNFKEKIMLEEIPLKPALVDTVRTSENTFQINNTNSLQSAPIETQKDFNPEEVTNGKSDKNSLPGNSDDDQMIAELEATFVSELK